LRDALFLVPLSEGKHFLFREIFIRNFEKHVKKKGPVNGQLSPYGSCCCAWKEFEKNACMIFFLGPRRHWKFNKEQGSPELISDYGAQRARL
jgi:hypothetical protein